MKNKLWVFGDSLSIGFNSKSEHCLYPKEFWWSQILADKFNMELISTAGAGNDRVQIMYKWLINWNDINKDDIVIYQMGFKDRYNLMPLNIPLFSLPNQYIPSNFEMTYNGEYGVDLFNKVVLEWGKNYNIWFWNVQRDWQEYSHIINKLYSPIGINTSPFEDWLEPESKLNDSETKYRDNDDGHFTKLGHLELANSFYKQIKT